MTTRSGKCFVPMCRTGYKGATGKFSLFRAPHDENLLQIWQRKIPRGDRNLTSRDVVCERHFTSSEIIKEWNSGSVSTLDERIKYLMLIYLIWFLIRFQFRISVQN